MVLNQLGIAHVTVSVAKKPAPGAGPWSGLVNATAQSVHPRRSTRSRRLNERGRQLRRPHLAIIRTIAPASNRRDELVSARKKCIAMPPLCAPEWGLAGQNRAPCLYSGVRSQSVMSRSVSINWIAFHVADRNRFLPGLNPFVKQRERRLYGRGDNRKHTGFDMVRHGAATVSTRTSWAARAQRDTSRVCH